MVIVDRLNAFVTGLARLLDGIVFFDISPIKGIKMPAVIAWIVCFSIFFIIKAKLFPFKFLPLGLKYGLSNEVALRQKATIQTSPIKHLQTSREIGIFSVGSNVDLGSIFGTAVVVQKFGAGVLFWMMIVSILASAVRMIETFVALNYRTLVTKGKENHYHGGPTVYIKKIFAERGFVKIGVTAAMVFWFSLIASTFSSPQINQTVGIVKYFCNLSDTSSFLLAILVSSSVILFIKTGFTKVSGAMSKVISFTSKLFFALVVVVIFFNRSNILPTLAEIFVGAFSLKSGVAGIVAMICISIQRVFFCTEAGLGSAAISEINTVNQDKVSESIISSIAPILSIGLVCFCSGLVVAITKAHLVASNQNGIEMLVFAFGTVHKLLPWVLLVLIPQFGFSTATAWAYYGQHIWSEKFGTSKRWVYELILFIFYIICGSSGSFASVLSLSDSLNLAIAFPNLLAIYVFVLFNKDWFSGFFVLSFKKMNLTMSQALR